MKKLLALSICISAIAHAESLDDRKYWREQTKYMTRHLETAEKACGTKFTHTWVEPEKFRAQAEKLRQSPFAICNDIVNRVAILCRAGDDEKATVVAKIKGFQCGFSNPRSLSLTGGTLRLMGNHTEANFDDWAKPWLQKQL